MVVLDTDHLSALTVDGPLARRLEVRIDDSHQEVATTVVSVEERINGCIVEIRRRKPGQQARPYREFFNLVETYARWLAPPWDDDAIRLFDRFRSQGIRIGTMDLKIACIAMAHDALLLTRNSVDFSQLPGLRSENWLD